VHCGTSTFPGALNQFADPILLDDVLRDFPDWTWCSHTVGAAGGTTPRRSWR